MESGVKRRWSKAGGGELLSWQAALTLGTGVLPDHEEDGRRNEWKGAELCGRK